MEWLFYALNDNFVIAFKSILKLLKFLVKQHNSDVTCWEDDGLDGDHQVLIGGSLAAHSGCPGGGG